MNYELKASTNTPGEWVVERLNSDGTIAFTLFSGSDAEARAKEYVGWKNRQAIKRVDP